MKVFLVVSLCVVVSLGAPIDDEKRDLLSSIGGLLGGGGGGSSGGSSGLGGLLSGVSGLLGGGGASTGTATGTAGSAAAGSTAGAAAGTSSGGIPGAGALGAISGLSDGLFNVANSILEHGHRDPHNGADAHHNAAEHGAQSAILKALQNGAFVG